MRADIVAGAVFPDYGVASHYCFDHVTFDDIVVPTFRRVVKRRTDGPVIHGPTAVLILISDVSLT